MEEENGSDLPITELIAERPVPEEGRAKLCQPAIMTRRYRAKSSTFETLPGHLCAPKDVDALAYACGNARPWEAARRRLVKK